ncbi:hypothetical protein [Mucilaginibacter sp. 3215]|uniref:hypothetical protein n=1 Tax=Mucilaginibacter sp. 3215 TaxID=3373912 RepID=UPI003D19FB09
MQREILKEQIKEAIDGRTVKAALFYTFNFDPAFFENYVMPLLVPGKTFQNETIYNNILWRRCAKEGIVPPVTVYCDHYAKDNAMAPTLGYEIRCVRLGGRSGSLVNFHPKECWLLLDDNELIQVNSSANLTPSGWCENLECCTVLSLGRNSHPKTKTRTKRQQLLETISGLASEKVLSPAEDLIYNALRYTNDSDEYFSNLFLPFFEVVKNISERISPYRVEIIAPYMYGEAAILTELDHIGINDIYCLVPSLKTNEVLLSKNVFIGMMEKGVQWCNWINTSIGNEPRNLHAKVYRIYGQEKVITITGSVNFTGPAWRRHDTGPGNDANIESAIIHWEDNTQEEWLRPIPNLNINNLKFLSRDDVNITEMTGAAGRDAPFLTFTLNWKTKQLSSNGKLSKARVRFKSLLLYAELHKARTTFELSAQDIKQLTKNALIELVSIDDESLVYTYYPQQIEIDSRPLDFRLNPETILSFWLSGNDPYFEDELTGRIAEQVTDEFSGEVAPDDFESPSLLNDMARHFSGVNSLEKKLFDQVYHDPAEQFRTLRYYLLTENLDTVQFYIKGLRTALSENRISRSFYWMILQILRTRIYDRALQWPHRKMMSGEWAKFKAGIVSASQAISTESAAIAPLIDGLKEKAEWIITQLRSNHD